MASPPDDANVGDSQQPETVLGKRKRDGDDGDDTEDTLFIRDESSMSLVVYGSNPGQDPDDSSDDDEEGHDDEEEDEDESLDGDDDDEQKHMESSEPLPNCAIYDADISDIKAKLISIPKSVMKALLPYECPGKHVQTHMGAANALLKIPDTKRLRVALIGAAGVGKSSTLNAITDIPDLANSLAGGESCTNVMTFYSGPFGGQSKNYGAIIEYYSMPDIRDLLLEYVDHFILVAFHSDDQWDQETRQMFHKRAVTAINTLHLLFCDLEDFSTRQAAKAFLAKDYQEESNKAIEIMLQSCQQKLKSKTIHEGAYSECCQESSRAKLRAAIDPLIGAKSTGNEPALWPLIKQVNIGVSGSRCLAAITIVDLPGTSDMNETRVKATRRCVKTCQYIWVVAPVQRIVDDGTTFDTVHRYGKLFQGRIAVICTKSDADVEPRLVSYLESKGQDMQSYHDLTPEQKDLKKRIRALNTEIKRERKKKTKQTKVKMLDTQGKEEERDALEKQHRAVEQRRFGIIVKARNQWAIEGIRNALDDYLPAGISLTVLCISNLHYAAIKAGRSLRGLRLSPEDTGVPALRAYALTLPAPGLLRTLDTYCNHTLNVFMKGIQLWVKTTHVERRAELLDIARLPLNKLETRVESRMKAFETGIKEHLVDLLHENFGATRAAAVAVLDEKRKKHPSTIRAFIRKYGNHTTGLCPQEAWNEHFMTAITDFVDQHWEAFEAGRTQITDELMNALAQDLRSILPDIAEQHPLSSKILPTRRLDDLVEAQVGALENTFDESLHAYSQDLRNIRMDIAQDSDTAFFSRTIRPVYDNCILDSGDGVTKRSLAKIEAHLTKPQPSAPFTEVEKALTKALLKNDAKHMQTGDESVTEQVEAIFESVWNAMDRLIDKTVEDPKERQARETLQAVAKQLEEEFKVAREMLTSVKERYVV
ncbi:hypothetical protein LTR10_000805 [Elasticomyces elasticus]|nr:hypothetical protein LTR10_000805 [Elasticomyces elasticus]KAK4979948.1 hypothetical protein LTR42_000255 [Elasticomyces elasticus]